MKDPNTKLLIAGAILLAALLFYFLGQGLFNPAEAPSTDPPPAGLSRLLNA